MNAFKAEWRSNVRRFVCVLACGLVVQGASGQADAGRAGGQDLQQSYDAAEKFQARNDLVQAAQEYRTFLADALGELAAARAAAGEYERAANDFDEALRLVPDLPQLQLEYARAALDSGNLEHAKLLATAVLGNAANDPKLAADGHAILGRVLLKMN